MNKKKLTVYEKYEQRRKTFEVENDEEDSFRKGFVLGYCAACDELRPVKKQRAPKTQAAGLN